jgi:hypothetical protein
MGGLTDARLRFWGKWPDLLNGHKSDRATTRRCKKYTADKPPMFEAARILAPAQGVRFQKIKQKRVTNGVRVMDQTMAHPYISAKLGIVLGMPNAFIQVASSAVKEQPATPSLSFTQSKKLCVSPAHLPLQQLLTSAA